MSKELDALERGIIEFEKDLEDDPNNEWLKRVVAGMKKCYQRLEAIDNANPSEALNCLEKPLIKFARTSEDIDFKDYEEYDTIKQTLLTKSKKEQAVDIIKNKNVDTKYLISIIRDKAIKDKDKLWIYNSSVSEEDELTEKEFEILNEVFKNE